MPRRVHGVVKDANHKNAAIFDQIINDVSSMPMAEKPRMEGLGRLPHTRLFRQGLQAIAQGKEIGVGLGFAKGLKGIDVYAVQIGFRSVR